jgi:ABC-type uncharacterized transport system involved in gliding motility auxiliary subunit
MKMKEHLKKADVLGLVLIAVTVISYSVQSIWSTYHYIALVLGGLLILVAVSVKSAEIRSSLGRRSARFGINSAVSVLFLVGILAFVNYLGAQHAKRVDMTTENLYSLSEQSVNVAQQVPQDLKVKAFYPGGEYAPTKEMLDLYKGRNNKISYEFIDPDKQPQIAQQYSVTQYGDNPMGGESSRYGTLILEMAGKTERIEKQLEPIREEDVTNALMKIVKGERKTIYFVQGHGEKSIDDAEKIGYSTAKAALEKENYVLKNLNLVQENKVPDDASVVVMIGPTAEPFPNELELLEGYLNKGGSVAILLDPPPGPSMSEFMKKWSIDVGNNFVVDASGVGRLFGAGPSVPLVTNYSNQKITEGFKVMTFFPFVRSVTPAQTPVAGITAVQLLASNERSWGESDLKSNQAGFDEKTDLQGPVSLAVVATKDAAENKKGRLVVYGDSDFASNNAFGLQGNGNLFLNTVSWLAQDESFISIRPKNPEDRRLTMTEQDGRLMSFVTLLFMPVGVLIAGVSVWMKRRK